LTWSTSKDIAVQKRILDSNGEIGYYGVYILKLYYFSGATELPVAVAIHFTRRLHEVLPQLEEYKDGGD
jgi:uncharacterized membrane protein (GlpM family)